MHDPQVNTRGGVHLTQGNESTGVGGKKRPAFEESYQLGKELGHGSFSTVREGTSKVSYEYMSTGVSIIVIAIGMYSSWCVLVSYYMYTST